MEFNRKTGGFFTQSRTYFSGCSARVILVGNRGRNEGHTFGINRVVRRMGTINTRIGRPFPRITTDKM